MADLMLYEAEIRIRYRFDAADDDAARATLGARVIEALEQLQIAPGFDTIEPVSLIARERGTPVGCGADDNRDAAQATGAKRSVPLLPPATARDASPPRRGHLRVVDTDSDRDG